MKKWFVALAMAASAVVASPLSMKQAHAAPFAPIAAAGMESGKALTDEVRWRGGGRGYHRGFYRPARIHRPWRRAYRPLYYRPRPYYAAPVYYGPPRVCRIRHRQVWNGWGYVWQPVRVCSRRW